jgi:hypothetical protein
MHSGFYPNDDATERQHVGLIGLDHTQGRKIMKNRSCQERHDRDVHAHDRPHAARDTEYQ